MTTRINKLTKLQVDALHRIDNEHIELEIGGSTATFNTTPREALAWLDHEMGELPTKGHPRASLHAVRRKLIAKMADDPAEQAKADRVAAMLVGDQPVHVPAEGEFHPEPGEQFQIMRGYQHDDTIFRVKDYAPITSPPEIMQKAYRLPTLPVEIVNAARIEKMPKGDWVGSSFHSFPTAIMVPVGSTARAFSEANGGRTKPRAPRSGGSTTGGRCEHCGEPTKGGRFIPGHDAKLKGELVREGTIEAWAEQIIRNWKTEADVPNDLGRITKLVAQGDGFLRSRITARIGSDPGGSDR
jgi:hypothetical protein